MVLVATFAVGAVLGGLVTWLGLRPAKQTLSGDNRPQVAARFAEGQAVSASSKASPEASEQEDYFKSLEDARQIWLLTGSLIDLEELAQRWAVDAPEEAFAAFVQLFEAESGFDVRARETLLVPIVFQCGKTDLDAALAGLSRVKDLGIRERLIGFALSGFAEVNAAAAFARLEASPQFQKPEFYTKVFSGWGRKDPQAAQRALASIENAAVRREAALETTSGWAQHDLMPALAWASRLADTPLRDEVLARIVEAAGSSWMEPVGGVQALELMEKGPAKSDAVESFARSVLPRWARQNPQGALDWVREAAEGELQEKCYAGIVKSLARSDHEFSLRVLNEMPNGAWRQEALTDFTHSWGAIEPESTLSWAETLPETDKDGAIETVARVWVDTNPRQAAGYAARLLENENPASFASKVANAWVDLDPQAAVAWAATLPGKSGDDVYREAFGEWVAEAPAQAASYAGGLKGLQERQMLYRVLTKGWVQRDPAALETWLPGVSPGLERDAAVEGLIEFYAADNPEAAAAWIATLSEEGSRKAWMERLHRDDDS